MAGGVALVILAGCLIVVRRRAGVVLRFDETLSRRDGNGAKASVWPVDGLEAVSTCPACGGADRASLHGALEDRVFGTAPGRWQLFGCSSCGLAYLDPRPSPQTLPLAYAHYYTHGETDVVEADADEATAPVADGSATALGGLRRVARLAGNGLRNRRYGLSLEPASRILGCALGWMPGMARYFDTLYRGLAPGVSQRRVLDVGCGDGTFLTRATQLGWDATGIDVDAAAISEARRRGHKAHVSTVDAFDATPTSFDAITLNHVIEHVSDPVATLERCHALLKPGAAVWLETPNMESWGHRWFGPHWRDLDAPRHLVLFDRGSLHEALTRAGFTSVTFVARPLAAFHTHPASRAIRAGAKRGVDVRGSWGERLLGLLVDLAAYGFAPRRAEFLTCVAVKAVDEDVRS